MLSASSLALPFGEQRTSMNQDRLNHCLILHAHQSLTDNLDLHSDFVKEMNTAIKILVDLKFLIIKIIG